MILTSTSNEPNVAGIDQARCLADRHQRRYALGEDGEMLTDYIRAAMERAHYEILPEDQGYFGTIPGFDGVWATAPTREACRDELQEVLEDWLLVALRLGHPLPIVNQIDLNLKESEDVA